MERQQPSEIPQRIRRDRGIMLVASVYWLFADMINFPPPPSPSPSVPVAYSAHFLPHSLPLAILPYRLIPAFATRDSAHFLSISVGFVVAQRTWLNKAGKSVPRAVPAWIGIKAEGRMIFKHRFIVSPRHQFSISEEVEVRIPVEVKEPELGDHSSRRILAFFCLRSVRCTKCRVFPEYSPWSSSYH